MCRVQTVLVLGCERHACKMSVWSTVASCPQGIFRENTSPFHCHLVWQPELDLIVASLIEPRKDPSSQLQVHHSFTSRRHVVAPSPAHRHGVPDNLDHDVEVTARLLLAAHNRMTLWPCCRLFDGVVVDIRTGAAERAALLVHSHILGKMLFPLFILLCGLSHFIHALTLSTAEPSALLQAADTFALCSMMAVSMATAIYLTVHRGELTTLLAEMEIHRKGRIDQLVRNTATQHELELGTLLRSIEAVSQTNSTVMSEAIAALTKQITRIEGATVNDQLFLQLKTLLTSTADSVNSLIAFVVHNEEAIGGHWHAVAKIKVLRNEVYVASDIPPLVHHTS